MDNFRYRGGLLHVEEVPLEGIAETFSTPTYVYSRHALAEAWHTFDEAFSSRDHLVCYAVKANGSLGILNLLSRLGSGFDVVSGGELERVIEAGGDPRKTVFSGVGKQPWEIELALDVNIACFNIESASELLQVSRLAHAAGKTAPVSIRVNPDVDARTHPYISTGLKENKFGVSPEDALSMYRQAASLPGIRILGIDFHIGSQIVELEPFIDSLRRVLSLVDELEKSGIVLSHIDLGGGLGISYRDEQPVDIRMYAREVLRILGDRPLKLLLEPGRLIAGDAGILITRVITIKENGGRKFAVVDAAMNDLLRPALYGAWQRIVNVRESDDTPGVWDIVGPVCESTDFLGKDRELVLEEGDLLAICSAGAYGFAMSSNYNSRNRAAEVMVSGQNVYCIRKRETIADQIRLESMLPNHLQ